MFMKWLGLADIPTGLLCALVVALAGPVYGARPTGPAAALEAALNMTCEKGNELQGDFLRQYTMRTAITGGDLPCIAAALNGRRTAKLWVMLGESYRSAGDHENEKHCYQEAKRLSASGAQPVSEWLIIGPFPSGKTEHDGDPLAAHGGIQSVPLGHSSSHYSELGGRGEVQWRTVRSDAAGSARVEFSGVPWNSLVQALGSTAVIEFQAWAVSQWVVAVAGTYIVHCKGLHTVRVLVNTTEHYLAGDLYGRQHLSAIKVPKGIHYLYTKLRGKASAQFSCVVSKARTHVKLFSPLYVPDIVEGALIGDLLAVPLLNVGGDWLDDVEPHILDNKFTVLAKATPPKPTPPGFELHDNTILDLQSHAGAQGNGASSIAPYQLKVVNVRIALKPSFKCEGSSVRFDLTVRVNGALQERDASVSVTLRCRAFHESFLYTYINHDGSVSHASAIAPLTRLGKKKFAQQVKPKYKNAICEESEACVNGEWPVVLSQHGTGVSAASQADSYKQKGPNAANYTFGIASAWLVAPSRHGAHNWEGVGRFSAVAALLHLYVASKSLPFPSSITRVVYAGHSMGGHGAMHLATHEPDRAIGVLPLAGWIKKEHYGDANLIFRYDIQSSHMDAMLKGVIESSITGNDNDLIIDNIVGVPSMFRVGQYDHVVHPWDSRRAVRLLKEKSRGIESDIQYVEIPGKEHWWWDTESPNDGGSVNDPQIRAFIAGVVHLKASPLPVFGGSAGYRFSFKTVNPAANSKRRGIIVHQLLQSYKLASFVAEVTAPAPAAVEGELCRLQGVHLALSTHNVRMVEVTPQFYPSLLELVIDGTPVGEPGARHGVYVKDGKTWVPSQGPGAGERGPASYGPARQVFDRPFDIVAGPSHLNLAVYLCGVHALAYDTSCAVHAVRDYPPAGRPGRNVVLVGTPEENPLLSPALLGSPLHVGNGTASLSGCPLPPSAGIIALRPFGDSRLALAVTGATTAAVRRAGALAEPTVPPMTRAPFGNMVPDYIVVGDKFDDLGLGGLLAAGYWDYKWDVEARSSYSAC